MASARGEKGRVGALARALAATVVSVALTGCAASMLEKSRVETAEILDRLDAQVREERATARAATATAERAGRELPDVELPPVVGLEDALRIAALRNRDLIQAREGLQLSAVSLRNAERDVGVRLAGSISYLLAGSDDAEQSEEQGVSLSATDLLPTGGELSLTGDVDRGHGRGSRAFTAENSSADGSISLRLTQPLLRDAGYEASHEALTDAERQALYDVRNFELQRQDLALRVQREFYSLVSQKAVITNREVSLENFEFLQKRSVRLFEVGRVSEVDKFRAAREYLTSENALIDATQEFAARLDRFKILLGIESAVQFDVLDEIPDPRAMDLDLEDAINVALRNRLDVMTSRNQVEDSERRLRIAERDLLPSLELEAVRTRRDTERRINDLTLDRDSYSVGVSLELPLDRVRERGALRSAKISVSRARRSLALLEDNVILEVRESLRDLRSATNSLAIQEQIVASEEKNAKVARLRFEQGEIGINDLTDALTGLTDASDRHVREQTNVETARLQLVRDLGVLVIEEDGTWNE